MTATDALAVEGLTKRFGDTLAVGGINFAVPAGGVTALLGGNGAGKTTTIAMILGLITPTEGRITVLGRDLAEARATVAARMNFQSPYVDLPKRLSVRENLLVYARLYGLDRASERVEALASDLDLTAFLKKPFGQLSAGQKTRVGLAKALVNQPDLLLLDEPTASLDPDTADWVRSYLEAYRRRTGATIFLASHHMGEVERLCDTVLMMAQGRIVDRGTPRALLAKYGRANLEEVFLDVARGRARAAGGPAEAGDTTDNAA